MKINKSLQIAIGISILILWLIGSFFFNRTAYSSIEFGDVLIIIVIAVAFSVALWTYRRLARQTQRNLQLFGLGAMACCTSASLIWYLLLVARMLETFQSFPNNSQPEITTIITLAAPILLLAANSIYWFSLFVRVLKNRVTKSD